ncbi:MAG: sialate O-acetylesterase, partial [Planctomycetota bacterium]
YDDALDRVQRAVQDGVLKGILWHQGESDAQPALAEAYEKNLRDLIARFRRDLAAPALPFVIGQLGMFPQKAWNVEMHLVNGAHLAVARSDRFAVFVSSEGLTCRPDNVHFDAKSLRAFGQRYAEAYAAVAE